jgi:hypothetical protein
MDTKDALARSEKIYVLASSTSSNSLGRALSMAITASVDAEVNVYAFEDGPTWVGAGQFGFETIPVSRNSWKQLAMEICNQPNATLWSSKNISPQDKVISHIRQNSDVRIVVDFDDDDYSLLKEYRKQNWRHRLVLHRAHRLHPKRIRRSQLSSLKNADGATFSSWTLADIMRTQGISSAAITTARVPHTRTSHPRYAKTESAHALRIGFIGTVRPHKGLEVLKQAAMIPNIEICVFKNQVHKSVVDNFGFTEFDPATPLYEVYKYIDVLAVPSNPDSDATRGQLPAKIMDATAAGCPILATPTKPIDEFLKGSYLTSMDWIDLSKLPPNSSVLHDLGRKSAAAHDEFFSPEATARQLRILLQRISSRLVGPSEASC